MIRKTVLTVVFSMLVVACAACAPKKVVEHDITASCVENSQYSISLIPVIAGKSFRSEPNAFHIVLMNKTNKDIELVWDETVYITRGGTRGLFMQEGDRFADASGHKPNDIIFSGTALDKTIWPCALTEFSRSWWNNPMPIGENGAVVTLIVDGEKKRERLMARTYIVDYSAKSN